VDNDVIGSIDKKDRRKFCVNDKAVHTFLLAATMNKAQSPGLADNLRAYANLLSRFFMPLLAKYGWKSTKDVCVVMNASKIRRSMLSVGNNENFFEDTDCKIRDLENLAVSDNATCFL
jgi:hypothetical protein